ncbi:MAG TPA: acetate--CoA ligase family protein [Candidatus Sulfotelmatobacter sp.]|nr:acetate--CoA ligase family protein [Candidatus Sulfotelmatobacter sp.]
MSRRGLERLFAPRSIAVVGASTAPDKAGHQLLKNLRGFDGALYPINSKADEVLGYRAYPTLAAIGTPVDLVALAIPADACPPALAAADAAGAGGALIAGGGFGESGASGASLQDALATVCRNGSIRLLGPNTAGFANPVAGFAASFAPGLERLPAGRIAVVAQSAGVNITTAFLLQNRGYGARLAVGLGNSVDVTAADVVDWLADDPHTDVIALHLEGIPNGRALTAAIRRAVPAKAVVALTVGRADVATFAQSHTGNLIGDYARKRAALRAAGAVLVETTDDLVDAAIALVHGRIPPTANAGVGLMTAQAGPGLLMLDALRASGVRIPTLGDAAAARIAELLPPMTYVRNPVDTARPAATYPDVLRAIAGDPDVDALAVYTLHEPAAVDPVAVFRAAKAELGVPVVFGTMGIDGDVAPTFAALRELGVAAYPGPERAARAVRALVEDAAGRASVLRARATANAALSGPVRAPLDELGGKALLRAYGIATPRAQACATRAEAHAAFTALAKPVVVKVLNPAILHKTEAGGVHLFVDTPERLDAALDAIDRIDAPAPSRYVVEEMAPPGLELIVGALNDPSFGPTVLIGMGGTQAEALRDTATAPAPLDADDALALLGSLRTAALLDGWRGAPAVDRRALADAIVAVGRLIAAHPEVAELDVNPLRAYPGGVLALDAAVVLAPGTSKASVVAPA